MSTKKEKKISTNLFSFAVYGNLQRLKFFWPYLTEKNPLLPKLGITPLHYVVLNGKADIANFMIENLEDCNPASRSSDTPLHLAYKNGCFEIVNDPRIIFWYRHQI